jgi:hypothetical protein
METEVDEQVEAVTQSLGQKLISKQKDWYDALDDIREGWLKRLRAYHKIDEAKNAPEGGDTFEQSTVYVGLTRTKCQAAYSKVVELEFPGGKRKNWGILPTEEPDLALPPDMLPPNPLNDEVIAKLQQMPPQEADAYKKQVLSQYREQKDAALKAEAERRSKKMERKIEDQLSEQRFDISFREALKECTILGTACIKGPTVGVAVSRKWQYDRNSGGWAMKDEETVVPNIDSVSVFDLAWDPYATDTNDMEGIFQRHLMTRRNFRALGDLESFDDKKIAKIIMQSPNGNHVENTVDTELKSIAKKDSTTITNRFEVFEFWGSVDGVDLFELGVDGLPEDYASLDFDANLWICDGEVIKHSLQEKGQPRIPHKIFTWEKSLYQVPGVGVAEMMDDQQEIMNKSMRNILDNSEASKFPMIEMNIDFIDPLKPASKQYKPGKIFYREGGDASAPLLRAYNIPTTIQDNVAIYNMARAGIDDVTSLPSYTHGEGIPGGSGVTRTAAGMSMLMGASNINLKSVALNIDDYVLSPLITDIYNFNMIWCEDESIKGDMKVIATGAASLMAQEVKLQAYISFLQTTANPIDAQVVERPWILRQVAENLELDSDKAVKSDEALKQASEEAKKDPMNRLQQLTLATQVQEAHSRYVLNMAKVEDIMNDAKMSRADKIAKLSEVSQDIMESKSRIMQNVANAYKQGASVTQDGYKLLLETMNAKGE